MRSSIVLAATLVALAACRPPGYGEDGDDDGDGAADAGVDAGEGAVDAAPAVDAGADAALVTCEAAFTYTNEGASEVLLTGDFVSWAGSVDDGAVALVEGEAGLWSATRTFDAGVHQYKLIVDGAWIADPANPDTVPDNFGGVNSVYTCD